MNKGVKIFSILVFLLSLGAFYLASQVVMELAGKREEVKNLTQKVSTLEMEKENLTQQVNNLTQTKKRLEGEVANLKTIKARLESKLNAEMRKTTRLTQELSRVKKEKASIEKKLKSIEGEFSILKTRINNLQKERDKYRKLAEEEKKKRERLEKELAFLKGEKPKVGKEEKLVPQIEKGIVGKVLEFQSPGVVAMKFNSAVNLQPGTTLYAFRKGKVVGKLTVKEIYSTLLVVYTEVESLDEKLKKDDILRITRWVPEK
ncbi:MAG TPA: hypothetical protein ENG13_04550 [bacterium]|nr:hypothetical protein [bacterium]HEX68315.1 hypothetical protein [bacterium]